MVVIHIGACCNGLRYSKKMLELGNPQPSYPKGRRFRDYNTETFVRFLNGYGVKG